MRIIIDLKSIVTTELIARTYYSGYKDKTHSLRSSIHQYQLGILDCRNVDDILAMNGDAVTAIDRHPVNLNH